MSISTASDLCHRRHAQDQGTVAALDLRAEAEALGLRFAAGAQPSDAGWLACHAIDREDSTPSATFNVRTGRYRDHGGNGVSLSLFDLAAATGAFPDWRAARDDYAAKLGGRESAGCQRQHNPPRTGRNGHFADGTCRGRSHTTAEAARKALEAKHRSAAASWEYRDGDGRLLGLVLRWDRPNGGKDIRPISLRDDGWHVGAMPEPRPLYRLPELLASPGRVYATEGEKAADAVASVGLVATTSPGGAKAAAKADWSPLAGRDVVILPDNDTPGRAYAEAVAGILAGLDPPASVRVCELPGLNDKEDADDWINTLHDAVEADTVRDHLDTLADATAAWTPPAPEPPGSSIPSWVPFPTEVFPEPLRGYVIASAAAIGCDESFVALPLLAALAGLVGNTRQVLLKGTWPEPAVVWVATVGESGTHKSPGFDHGTRPLMRLQKEVRRAFKALHAKWREEHAAWETAAKEAKREGGDVPPEPVEPICPALWIDDATIEAIGAILAENERGTFAAVEELAGWFASFDAYRGGKGGDAAKWLRMFGGRDLRIDRRTGTPRTLYISHASVSVAGTIQPGLLRKHFNAENRESGLGARLLLAWPPRRPIRWTEAEVQRETTEAVDDLFAQIYGQLDLWTDATGDRRPSLVRVSADAKWLFRQFMNEHGEEHAAETGDLAAAFSKLIGYAARFALLFAIVRRLTGKEAGPAEEVDAESMADGIRLARWFADEARRVYRLIDTDDTERAGVELAEWIDRKHAGEVYPRDLISGRRSIKTATDAEEALGSLVKAGFGSWVPKPAGPRGGPPTRLFRLFPQWRVSTTRATAETH